MQSTQIGFSNLTNSELIKILFNITIKLPRLKNYNQGANKHFYIFDFRMDDFENDNRLQVTG